METGYALKGPHANERVGDLALSLVRISATSLVRRGIFLWGDAASRTRTEAGKWPGSRIGSVEAKISCTPPACRRMVSQRLSICEIRSTDAAAGKCSSTSKYSGVVLTIGSLDIGSEIEVELESNSLRKPRLQLGQAIAEGITQVFRNGPAIGVNSDSHDWLSVRGR